MSNWEWIIKLWWSANVPVERWKLIFKYRIQSLSLATQLGHVACKYQPSDHKSMVQRRVSFLGPSSRRFVAGAAASSSPVLFSRSCGRGRLAEFPGSVHETGWSAPVELSRCKWWCHSAACAPDCGASSWIHATWMHDAFIGFTSSVLRRTAPRVPDLSQPPLLHLPLASSIPPPRPTLRSLTQDPFDEMPHQAAVKTQRRTTCALKRQTKTR
jgi:hypothetical protein